MKKITCLSLALIMSSLFSISYLMTSASAQSGNPAAPTAAPGIAPTGTPGMAPTGTPGMAPTGTPESGISGWIKGGLKALGIGAGPTETKGAAPAMGDISHCAEFSGPPKAACEAAASAPQPKVGDISHCAEFSGPPKAACEAAAAGH